MTQPLNDTAREINHNVVWRPHAHKAWVREAKNIWVEQGLDRKMSFQTFLKRHRKRLKLGVVRRVYTDKQFASGKYQGLDIGTVILQDPGYIEHILANLSDSRTSKEIIYYCQHYPQALNRLTNIK